jgi:alpha-L-fucosidase
VTEAQYRAMMTAALAEVWGRYPGALTELWFDGSENNQPLNELIARLQPQAVLADGTLAPNLARLVGQESGYAPYPVWSTTAAAAQDGSGDPLGAVFCPAEADTPVAEDDAWFWKPATTYRPLSELYSVYKNTVGANSLLELGVLPDNTGSIPADQLAVLQGLGDYIRACHSPAAALATAAAAANVTRLSVSFPLATVDRVILQEDLALGQLVWAFTVWALPAGGFNPQPIVVAEGTAIGHKRILYFQSGPLDALAVTVEVTQLRPGASAANLRTRAVYAPCAHEAQPPRGARA